MDDPPISTPPRSLPTADAPPPTSNPNALRYQELMELPVFSSWGSPSKSPQKAVDAQPETAEAVPELQPPWQASARSLSFGGDVPGVASPPVRPQAVPPRPSVVTGSPHHARLNARVDAIRSQWRRLDAQVFALNTQLRALEDQETEVTGLPFGEYNDSAVSQVARATPFGGSGAAGPSV